MSQLKNYVRILTHDFSKMSLDESEVDSSPFIQFEKWFVDAVKANVPEPNAMVLSTASAEGRPSGRVLLLRSFGEEGFAYYTNYLSRKAKDLEDNPYGAMTFFWSALERQVRIEGLIAKQEESDSDIYFNARPDASKLGAWASPQSSIIKSRASLDERYNEMKMHFKTEPITRPPFWGGYVLKPQHFEFWQGRPGRMHDRIYYEHKDNHWQVGRLAP